MTETKQTVDAPTLATLVAVKLTRRRWGGSAQSDVAAQKIVAGTGIDRNDVFAGVTLIPPELDHEIGCAHSRILAWWRARTLPWEDGGWRCVAASQYMALMDGLAPLKAECDAVAEAVAARYGMLREKAEGIVNKLGTTLAAVYFPVDALALRAKFGIEFYSRPIQAPEDMRVAGLNEAAVEQMRRSIEAAYREQAEAAAGDAVNRILTLLFNFQEKLDRASQRGLRYESFQAAASETIRLVRALPFTERLAPKLAEVERALTRFAGETLRERPDARQQVRQETVTLAAQLEALL